MAGVMPVIWKPIRDALHAWLSGQLGFSVDWARQKAPALHYPYGLLDIVSGPVRQHWDQRIPVAATAEDGTEGVKVCVAGDRTITVSAEALVSFEGRAWDYDADAFAYATLAQASLELEEVIAALGAVGLGILEVGAVQDRRTALEAQWVSRAGFDTTYSLVSFIEPATVAPKIETVQIAGDLGETVDWPPTDFDL